MNFVKRSDIQFLRAIAILMVVLFHLDIRQVSGGFIGVDIFFVISGYLVIGQMMKQKLVNKFSLLSFFARRIKRLLIPSSVCLVFILFCLEIISRFNLFPPNTLHKNYEDVSAAALHVANIHYYMGQSAYFKPDTQLSFVLHYWSLGVEEQFYVLYPVLIIIVFGALSWVGWPISKNTCRVFLAVSGVFSCSLCFILDDNAKFFLVFPRIWEFSVGALVALEEDWLSARVSFVIVQWVGIASLVVGAVYIPKLSYPNGYTIPVVFVTAYIILCNKPINFKATDLIGDWSYSIYLYHFPIIRFVRLVFLDFSDKEVWLLSVTVTTVLTMCSYYAVDKKVLELQWKPIQWFVLFFLLSVFIATAPSIFHYENPQNTSYNNNLQFKITKNNNTSRLMTEERCRPLTPSEYKQLYLKKLKGFQLPPPLPPIPGKCIIMWGDSHVLQWQMAIKVLGNGLATVIPAYTLADWNLIHEGMYAAQNSREPPQLWKDSNCTETLIFIGTVTNTNTDWGQSRDVLFKNMVETVTGWAKYGCVVVFVDTPNWGRDRPPGFDSRDCPWCGCTNRPNYDNCYALRNTSLTFFENKLIPLNILNVHVWSIDKYICGPTVCPANYDDIPIYHDDHHLSDLFVGTIVPSILQRELRENLWG